MKGSIKMWNSANSIKSRDRQGAVAQVLVTLAGAVSRRIPSFAIGAAILTLSPCLAQGAGIVHAAWGNLSMVTGQTVRIALPGGAVITGKAASVESDALVIDVKKTSDRNAYPKGTLRVPRENVHWLEMRSKGAVGRITLTSLGSIVGLGGGAAAYVRAFGDVCWFSCNNLHPGAAAAAFVGIAAAGAAGGYFAGNALDKRWTEIEIQP
jgi:hypothetical protein